MIDKDKIITIYNRPKAEDDDIDTSKLTRKGSARRKERSKFFSSFIGDHNDNIKDYIIDDVLAPFAKDIVVSIVENFSVAVQVALFGKAYKPKAGGSRVLYDKMGGREQRHTSHSVSEVFFDYREDALEVLEIMQEIIEQKDEASVADFYQLCKLEYDKTDRLWGWRKLREIKPERSGNEWVVNMPKPREL